MEDDEELANLRKYRHYNEKQQIEKDDGMVGPKIPLENKSSMRPPEINKKKVNDYSKYVNEFSLMSEKNKSATIQTDQYSLQDVGPQIPQDVGPQIPQDVGPQVPQDGPQIPQDVGPQIPQDVGPSIPPDIGPQIPQDLDFDNENNNQQLQSAGGSNIDAQALYLQSQRQRYETDGSKNGQITNRKGLKQKLDNRNSIGDDNNIDSSNSDDDSDIEGEEYEEGEDPYQLPISHEILLQGHTKVVSALDIDRPGGRLISGSHDYDVLMYDFNGMKNDFKFFRQMTPNHGYPVNALSYSPSGDCFLCVTGSSQAKIYDRDGRELGETVKGDMYIRDLKNTRGHVMALTSGAWHPVDTGSCLTCGEDGSLRIFDTFKIDQKTVIKPQLTKPGRVAVTACCYSHDGTIIAGGLRDGQIQLWSSTNKQGGKFGSSAAIPLVLPPMPQMVQQQNWSYVARPTQIQKQAHANGETITGLKFSYDNRTLASRSTDGTLGLWDVRNVKTPLKIIQDLPTSLETTQVAFSPSGDTLVTGTDQGVVFINTQTFETVNKIELPQRAGVLNWHPRINQIAVGQGNSDFKSTKHNDVRVLYSTRYSQHGALFCVGKNPKPREDFAVSLQPTIVNPHALPLFREGYSRKRKKDKDQQDFIKTKRPEGGDVIGGLGRGGKLGATGGTMLAQYLMKQRGELKSVAQEMDPREAILRHKTDGDQYNSYTRAYQQTQPDRIYHQEEKNDDSENEDE